MDKILIKQCLFYGSYLAFPFIAWLLWKMRKPGRRLIVGSLLAASLLFAWSRFVEPQLIRVRETTLSGTGVHARIALISDIHLGIYKDRHFLERVVTRINALPVDAVVIAGDLTYEPAAGSLHRMFSPLARLRRPVYAVLGNHDQQMPGADIDQALRNALTGNGVRIIEGRTVDTGSGYRWAGLGDHWAGKDDPAFLKAAPNALPTLVVVHNPDSAMRLAPADATLVLAGHTHGGQIRIPWLYRKVIPTAYDFDRGEQLAHTPQGNVRVFTTTGLGEIGLPMRLFNPPTIDLLHLRP
ncbi:MAG: metallophosphoesterase [Pseudoxanthomonas sp.]